MALCKNAEQTCINNELSMRYYQQVGKELVEQSTCYECCIEVDYQPSTCLQHPNKKTTYKTCEINFLCALGEARKRGIPKNYSNV